MILITIDCSDIQDGDLRTCDRILRGVSNLTKDGYTVERYDNFTTSGSKQPTKKIIAIFRTSNVNDTEFLRWLDGIRKTGREKDADALPI